jgi:hypothetical protein
MLDERYFSPDPLSWRPERWLSKDKEVIMDQRACASTSVFGFRKRRLDRAQSSPSRKVLSVRWVSANLPEQALILLTDCAGRLLALLELRIFLIHIMLHFTIEPAPGYDPKAFDDGVRILRSAWYPVDSLHAQIAEYFTVQKAKPFVARLTPRSTS